MALIDKNCSFEFSEKDPAQNDKYVSKTGNGTIVTEPYLKKTDRGEYMMIVVHESDSGKIREVFINSVTIK